MDNSLSLSVRRNRKSRKRQPEKKSALYFRGRMKYNEVKGKYEFAKEKIMIRIATRNDVDSIVKIYEHIHDAEEAGEAVVGWDRNVYPTYQTALESVLKGDMFVEEDKDIIVAAGRINQEQVKEYAECPWLYQAADHEVMVLHTLVVDPYIKGKGYGSACVKFYEEYARSRNCHTLRIDTNEKNIPARKFYQKLGFREAGFVLCNFNGIAGVRLVCLEKKI